MAIIVAGGAGFIGSHLVDRVASTSDVVVFDNMFTGRLANLEAALKSERAVLVYADVAQPAEPLEELVKRATSEEITTIYQFASFAVHGERTQRPWSALAVHGAGTMQLLKLAERFGARFVFASTAESVFAESGSPLSAHAEGKRFGEALTIAAASELGIDARIVRIPASYGPRMPLEGGDVAQALFGSLVRGTRPVVNAGISERKALVYVSDIVDGVEIIAAAPKGGAALVSLEPSETYAIADIIEAFVTISGTACEPQFVEIDAVKRYGAALGAYPEKPAAELGWQPRVGLTAGLTLTCDWFRDAAKRYTLV
jgi:nucleoside-diphosphate-sugar epimerase